MSGAGPTSAGVMSQSLLLPGFMVESRNRRKLLGV